MSHQLPLQIRKDVRDVFENEDSTVRKSFQRLAEVIGYPVSCDPEWHMIWVEVQSAYPDKATFIPEITKVVEVWSDSLARRLQDDTIEAWTEELLEKLKLVGEVKLSIQTTDATRVETSWSKNKSAFMILLPTKIPLNSPQAASAFAGDFETIFEPAKHAVHDQQAQNPDDDDWADIISNADSRSLPARTHPDDRAQIIPDNMPSLQTLPRPEVLFQTITPYLMQVSCAGTSTVTVNGTHEPSLRLLAEYLQRWIKTDPQDIRKIPYLRIKMQESRFGLGLFHDSLTLEPFDHRQRNVVVNVSLILVFIEGVLGYQPVIQNSSAGYWEFKRHRPFAKSGSTL